MVEVVLLFVVVLPIAWLISEFSTNRPLRVVLGLSAIAMSFGIAWIVGSLERLQSNSYFAEATKDLIQNTIVELEKGNHSAVLQRLKDLRSDFEPTYETRDDYDVLVNRYVRGVSKTPIFHDAGELVWATEAASNHE
jgi:hypothetical protein